MASIRGFVAAGTAFLISLSLSGTSLAAEVRGDPPELQPLAPPTSTDAPSAVAQSARVIPGRIVVQWAPDASPRDQSRALAALPARDATDLGTSFQTLRISPNLDPVAAAQRLAKNPQVVWAGPDFAYSLHASAPSDPYFSLQWGLNNTGLGIAGRQALAGADISALDAWDHTKGSSGTVIAVLDSGHRAAHPDLVNRQWVNPGEAGGTVGIDDDDNGIVDDINGVDFVGEHADDPEVDSDPTDPLVMGGHGIHVAGIAAAQGDNGTGITGVAQDARIMALRVCGWSDTFSEIVCPTSAQIAAINYAGAKQVRAANLSLGGPGLSVGVRNALAANPGTLYVVSAGNDGVDNDSDARYPCVFNPASSGIPGAIDNVVCVAATDQSDRIVTVANEGWGSNWGGTTVDLAAPGSQIASAYPTTRLFYENFDSASFAFTGWNNPAGTGFKRSESAPLRSGGITNDTATQAPGTTRTTTTPARAVGMRGATQCSLQYWRQLTTGPTDSLLVEALVNGSPVVADNANSNVAGFYELVFPVEEAGTTPTVAVRFSFAHGAAPVANGVATPASNGVWLDDMYLSCFTPPGSEAVDSYSYSGGTSTAAPMVTGTVALLATYEPSATTTQLRSALLSSVDPIADLHPVTGGHKVSSGGRLNADAALAAIDALVAPDTVITSAPSGTVAARTASIGFAAAGTAAPATFQCALDSGAYANCVSPLTVSELSEGIHTVRVRARDTSSASNLDATPAVATWTVDAAPDTTIVSSPSGLVTSRSASIAFVSSEPSGTFACQLDGGAFAVCSSPKTYSGLSDGAHTFAVRAQDPAGNEDATPATANWVIDATPPDTVIDSAPSGVVEVTGATITFRSTEAGSRFTCRLDGAAGQPCTSPLVVGGLNLGGHTFSVAATDAAGLVDATPATASWIVVPPLPPATTPPVTPPPATTPPVTSPTEPTPPATTPPATTPPATTPPATTPPATTPPVTSSPAAPRAVSGISVAFPKKKNALVSWNTSAGATSYKVRLSKKNSIKKFNSWKTTSAPRYQFSGLTKKGRYLVQIVARNAIGSSPISSLRFRQAK